MAAAQIIPRISPIPRAACPSEPSRSIHSRVHVINLGNTAQRRAITRSSNTVLLRIPSDRRRLRSHATAPRSEPIVRARRSAHRKEQGAVIAQKASPRKRHPTTSKTAVSCLHAHLPTSKPFRSRRRPGVLKTCWPYWPWGPTAPGCPAGLAVPGSPVSPKTSSCWRSSLAL